VKIYKLLSAPQLLRLSKIVMIRGRKKEENKHRMKEGVRAIAIYDENEIKYSEKLLIHLSERKTT
jgi:hypothetical protein